jgi:hypothetical protein
MSNVIYVRVNQLQFGFPSQETRVTPTFMVFGRMCLFIQNDKHHGAGSVKNGNKNSKRKTVSTMNFFFTVVECVYGYDTFECINFDYFPEKKNRQIKVKRIFSSVLDYVKL